MKRNQEHFRGCLLGGAIGDALGWPVEFMSFERIVEKYGEHGIQDLVPSASGRVEITDDTQMTLFTAEGILRANTRGMEKGISDPASVVYYAYQRWLSTQGYPRVKDLDWIYDGWLLDVKGLHERRAPGTSCLNALSGGKMGTIREPVNGSKGCGGVMRVAPVGLFYYKDKAFQLGAEFAAITHGHPSGYLSAGALAYMIALIIDGAELGEAVRESLVELAKYEGHEECSRILSRALDLANDDSKLPDSIRELGEGWVGEEALAIAVYCALKYRHDFKRAVIAAINHDGDSDSTGAIAGNILGAYLGMKCIPEEWIDRVELKEVISQVADDLLVGYQDSRDWWRKYPGY